MGVHRFRLSGIWSALAHFLFGVATVLSAKISPVIALIMAIYFLVYEFEETVVDYFVEGKKEAVKWDWPEEELREYSAGVFAGVILSLL